MITKFAFIVVILALFALMVLSYRESYPSQIDIPHAQVCRNDDVKNAMAYHGILVAWTELYGLGGESYFERGGKTLQLWTKEARAYANKR